MTEYTMTGQQISSMQRQIAAEMKLRQYALEKAAELIKADNSLDLIDTATAIFEFVAGIPPMVRVNKPDMEDAT